MRGRTTDPLARVAAWVVVGSAALTAYGLYALCRAALGMWGP